MIAQAINLIGYPEPTVEVEPENVTGLFTIAVRAPGSSLAITCDEAFIEQLAAAIDNRNLRSTDCDCEAAYAELGGEGGHE